MAPNASTEFWSEPWISNDPRTTPAVTHITIQSWRSFTVKPAHWRGWRIDSLYLPFTAIFPWDHWLQRHNALRRVRLCHCAWTKSRDIPNITYVPKGRLPFPVQLYSGEYICVSQKLSHYYYPNCHYFEPLNQTNHLCWLKSNSPYVYTHPRQSQDS